MKKACSNLLVAFGGILAAALMAAAVALATPPADHWTVSLHASASSVSAGGSLTFTGSLKNNGTSGVPNQSVIIYGYANGDCSAPSFSSDSATTGSGGGFVKSLVMSTAGTYSFNAHAVGNGAGKDAWSGCVVVTVTAGGGDTGGGDTGDGGDNGDNGGGSATVTPPPPPENGIFLCYSAYQTEPGVWPENEAKALLAEGYWMPYAVLGRLAGGTTIGAYHLTCNIAATQSVSQSFMGGDGTVLGPAYWNVFGIYPVVGK